MSDIEEARIREISPEEQADRLRGESVVRLRQKRRRWPLLIVALALLLLAAGLLLLAEPEKKEGVSLQAARELVLAKKPAWKKRDVLDVLREGGFRATPGPPRSPLAVSVTMRRDGMLLRSENDRNWIPRGLLEKRM